MSLITLQNSVFIDNQSSDTDFLLLVQHSYDYIMKGIAFRIWTDSKLKSWDELKSYKPNIVIATNKVITEYATSFFEILQAFIKRYVRKKFY